MPLVECVPNFSEGRRPEVVDRLCEAVTSVDGVTLVGREMDADHNRAVLTFVGEADVVAEAAFRAVALARELIDLREHEGAHPRMGATDVVPFVPLGDTFRRDLRRGLPARSRSASAASWTSPSSCTRTRPCARDGGASRRSARGSSRGSRG